MELIYKFINMPIFVRAPKYYLLLTFFLQIGYCHAQSVSLIDFCGLRPAVLSDQIPEDLTSSRSAVIISMTEDPEQPVSRVNWSDFAAKIHADLRNMYIDPICYVYKDDFLSGPEVTAAFVNTFQERGVKNILLVEQKYVGLNESYDFKIGSFNNQANLIADKELIWIQKEAPIDLITLRLGRQIIRQDIDRTNFLIPEGPNILTDLPLFPGVHFSSYPGQIRRANLAVIIPEKISALEGLSASETQKIEDRNKEIDQRISEIESVMSLYPYKYEMVSYGDDETLYKKGFQFALFSFFSTGKTIKKMLNYKVTGAETDYISMVPKNNGNISLKTIPVDHLVYKYYIKQTIAHDAYVGKQWDSDYTKENALTNFILNLKEALK